MRYLLLYAEKELLADFSVFCLFRVGCEEARGKSENERELLLHKAGFVQLVS